MSLAPEDIDGNIRPPTESPDGREEPIPPAKDAFLTAIDNIFEVNPAITHPDARNALFAFAHNPEEMSHEQTDALWRSRASVRGSAELAFWTLFDPRIENCEGEPRRIILNKAIVPSVVKFEDAFFTDAIPHVLERIWSDLKETVPPEQFEECAQYFINAALHYAPEKFHSEVIAHSIKKRISQKRAEIKAYGLYDKVEKPESVKIAPDRGKIILHPAVRGH